MHPTHFKDLQAVTAFESFYQQGLIYCGDGGGGLQFDEIVCWED